MQNNWKNEQTNKNFHVGRRQTICFYIAMCVSSAFFSYRIYFWIKKQENSLTQNYDVKSE